MIVLAVAAGSTTTTMGDSRPSSGDESVNLSIALGVLSAFFAMMFIVLTILAIKKWRRLENQQIKNDNKASASTMKLKTSSKDNVNDPPVRPATLSVPLQKSSHRDRTMTALGPTQVNPVLPLALPAYLVLKPDVDFKIASKLTDGGFSQVFKCLLTRDSAIERNYGKKLAICKMVNDIDGLTEDENDAVFHQEVAIMSDLASSNQFVKIIGYCDNPNTIIMTFYELGNMYDLIVKKSPINFPDEKWDTPFIASLMTETASAIAEIHKRGIYHNDIKPENVFMQKNDNGGLTALLGDFSMAAVTSQEKLAVRAFKKSSFRGLSIPYAPPEILQEYVEQNAEQASRTVPGSAADVYAYGVSCYEIISRSSAWSNAKEANDIINEVFKGKRPPFSRTMREKISKDSVLMELTNVMEECWAQSYRKRPQMDMITSKLLKIKASIRR